MIRLRPAHERGHANHGWLDTHHSFSFAGYYDARHNGFRHLRVINDDRVAPGAGFPTHPHQDMEILTYVLEGAVEHADSMGNGSVIRVGEFQRMNAGRGVTHSEFNPSATEPLHLLQIWILPSVRGNVPEYDQKLFPEEARRNRLCLVASPTGEAGSFRIYQDARLWNVLLDAGARVEHAVEAGRHLWVQVARGRVSLGEVTLGEGDGAALSDEPRLVLQATEDADVLVFDMS